MPTFPYRVLLLLAAISFASPARAGSCGAGAVLGGFVGRAAGHHGLAGAAVGCAAGMYVAGKRERIEPPPASPVVRTQTPGF